MPSAIRDLRIKAGMTQAELAKRIGMRSPSTVTMWEKGTRNPSFRVLPVLAAALNVTVGELFEREVEK